MKIFVTNDDGVNAKGIAALIEMVKPYGEVIVLAPMFANSGMSHAVTATTPIRMQKIKEEENLKIYSCSGTPADCVKLAMSELLDAPADLMVAGINHGSNSSASVMYSGTLGATAEAIMYDMPAIGFSLCDYSADADFSACIPIGRKIIDKAIEENFGTDNFLSVNFPNIPIEDIQGIKVCRQSKGVWRQEFEKRTDPHGRDYYWLTGYYVNTEPDATDTDEALLAQGYVTVVPHTLDMTDFNTLKKIKDWKF